VTEQSRSAGNPTDFWKSAISCQTNGSVVCCPRRRFCSEYFYHIFLVFMKRPRVHSNRIVDVPSKGAVFGA
jgi:hypothetical protein